MSCSLDGVDPTLSDVGPSLIIKSCEDGRLCLSNPHPHNVVHHHHHLRIYAAERTQGALQQSINTQKSQLINATMWQSRLKFNQTKFTGPRWFSPFICAERQHMQISGTVLCWLNVLPVTQPTVSKTEGNESIDINQWLGFILSTSTSGLLKQEMLVPGPLMLPLQHLRPTKYCHYAVPSTNLSTAYSSLKPRWHNTTIVKPVVQPVWQPAVSCKQTFIRLSNLVVQPVWQPAVYTIQPFVKPVWQRVWQPVVSCIQTFYPVVKPLLTTGCIV